MGAAGDDDYDDDMDADGDGSGSGSGSDASGSWSTCSDPGEAGGEAGEAPPPPDSRRSSWSDAAEESAAATEPEGVPGPDGEAAEARPCLASQVGRVSLASPAAQQPQPAAGESAQQAAEQQPPQSGAAPVPAEEAAAAPPEASPLAEALGFPHFAVDEECPPDHAFAAAAGRPSRRFQAAVLAEWRSLERNLPASIWVRAYESRMDLMRFAVLAAAGTPYAGHLFLFDLQLPPDYPAKPPAVLYHSWGLRVNPNLYENGKVCLSLLGTWTGRAHEMWTPESTLLQLVVSIQGLILVPKPYFNEAGFERQTGSAEGEANSVLYNEQAALLTVRSAVHLLRRPPAGFGDFGYYKREKGRLLAPLQRIVDGEEQPAGEAGGEHVPSGGEAEAAPKASAGFRLMLRELLPRFRAALEQL